jgi:hypothetical protein
MDFYHLQDSYIHIIEEGFFHVPENILKPIKDFYIENYKKYLENGKGKISRRLYPPKDFKLDFTGTKFEFLNFRNPSITVYLTSKGSFYHDLNHDKEDTMNAFNHGNVYLQLNTSIFRRILYDTIEHEVMHYMQSLMKNLHNEYGAGFPNKNLWRKDVNAQGFSTDGSGRTRVSHTQRPIEYYPDLLTVIRQLFQNYHDKIKRSPDYHILIDNEKSKQYFFSQFLNAVNDSEYSGEVFDKDLTIDTFRQFKKISPEFYKKILNIAYNAFVNGQPNFNPKQIEKDLRMIELNNAFDRIQDNK